MPNKKATISLLCQEELIDSVSYGSGGEAPAPRPGASLSRNAGPPVALLHQGGTAASWCPATGPIYDGENLGTPGAPNVGCGRPTCEDGSEHRALRHPRRADLRLNEVLTDPLGPDANHEWLELAVVASTPVDLAGLQIIQRSKTHQTRRWHFANDTCQTALPGTYLLIGMAQPDQHFAGGIAADITLFGPPLYNGASVLQLRLPDETVLDEVALPAAPSGTVQRRDGEHWCQASEPGTPGSGNPACQPR